MGRLGPTRHPRSPASPEDVVGLLGDKMRDIRSTCIHDGGSSDGYVGLAIEAIERLAARRLTGVGALNTALLEKIIDLASSQDIGAAAGLCAALRESRVRPELIIDTYIPEAARAFGVAWLEDRLSFARVTIGVSRLQQLLHEMQASQSADSADSSNLCTAMVILPPGEQHTLGAQILAMQLRRKGVSVNIQVAPGLSDLSRLLTSRHFDAAMITLGGTERLEICVKLVKTLKQLTKGRLHVAIGGSVIGSCQDELAGSGADLVTNDLDVVISSFGLIRHHQAGQRVQQESRP